TGLPGSTASTWPSARRSPPSPRPCPRWPALRSPSRRRTSTGSPRARSPARCRRRCCASWASTGRSSATPSGGSCSAKRTSALRDAGLAVIACVGETDEERDRGETEDVLRRQIAALEPHESLVVAYEPVWAIGTGRTATPEQAQEAHALIRSLLDVPVLYGGSVKPENAGALLAMSDVDGALVGGASLEVESFAAICEAAVTVAAP